MKKYFMLILTLLSFNKSFAQDDSFEHNIPVLGSVKVHPKNLKCVLNYLFSPSNSGGLAIKCPGIFDLLENDDFSRSAIIGKIKHRVCIVHLATSMYKAEQEAGCNSIITF
jgi:hypothetical protein